MGAHDRERLAEETGAALADQGAIRDSRIATKGAFNIWPA